MLSKRLPTTKLVVAVIASILALTTTFAGSPKTLSYQGRLTDNTGTPLTGSYDLTFRLYDVPAGGSAFWTEAHTGVTVTDGLFSVMLGSKTPPNPELNASLFADTARWIGITVNSDPEISPRVRLAAVPYAFRVATVDGATGGSVSGNLSTTGTITSDGAIIVDGANHRITSDANLHLAPSLFSNLRFEGPCVIDLNGIPTSPDALTVNSVASASGPSGSADGIRCYAENTSNGKTMAGYFTAGGAFSGSGTRVAVHAGSSGSVDGTSGVKGVEATSGNSGSGFSIASQGSAYSTGSGTATAGYFYSYGQGSGTAIGASCRAFTDPTNGADAYGVIGGGIANGPGTGYGGYFEGSGDGAGTHYGVYALASGAGSYAGYFSGDVSVTGTLTKGGGAFKIDHPLDPENKYLQHSFVESPDMMNLYNGNATLDASGEATVVLPEYFESLNQDFRYQLTCVGGFAPVYVKSEISGNRFVIAGGSAGLKVSWQVTGVRKDAWAKANRIQVEVEKMPKERGKYLHPGAFGKPVEESEDHVRSPILDAPADIPAPTE